jgi:hypothetical protein
MALNFKKLRERAIAALGDKPKIPELTEITVSPDGERLAQLHEGHWMRGWFDRVDEVGEATDAGPPTQAEVYGRNGELQVAVNLEAALGQGSKGKLRHSDADALRDLGFKIPADGIVEWVALERPKPIRLG